MRYELFHNLDAGFMRGGTVKDRYVRGWDGELPLAGSTIPSMLERIFERHNRDDRPDGQSRPSLSIGDVVLVTVVAPHTKQAYTVARVGFEELDGYRSDALQVLEEYPTPEG